MFDFSMYYNISLVLQSFGGIKEGKLNKKAIAKQDESWLALAPEEIMQIERSIPMGKRVANAYVVPTGVMIFSSKAVTVIPARNLVWIYPYVFTQKMNFVPASKSHFVRLIDRMGNVHQFEPIVTGGFSKKTPAEDIINEIAPMLRSCYPGIYMGWNEQLAAAVENNFASVIASVDAQNNTNAYGTGLR